MVQDLVKRPPLSAMSEDPDEPMLPPVLAGHHTPAIRERVEKFYLSVAEIFEAWIKRRKSHHTQRGYRQDVESFIRFMGFDWPAQAWRMYTVTVSDVQTFRDDLIRRHAAPKTLNRRISSLSSFYKFLAATAAELRLPITVPNPAHAQFISRESTDPVRETKALSATRARQLMGLPGDDSMVASRDRAILRFYLYSGARIGTGCRLKVSDFHRDGEEATIRLTEKGGKHRTIGLHFAAAEAITEYIEKAGITQGPLFRPRRGPRSQSLAERGFDELGMYHVIMGYLRQIPGAMKKAGSRVEGPESGDASAAASGTFCIYTPHSLRATTATLLLGSGVDIRKVQDLLGHRHVTTTQIYDKRRIAVSESASHDVPI